MSQEARWWIVTACGAALLFGGLPATAGETPWTAPAVEKSKKNPVRREVGVQEGRKVFDLNCSMCHRPPGKGDGPAGAALDPKPKDLTSGAAQAETDGELFWKISTGRGPMPPWQSLPEKQRWSLVHYIRSLAGKK
jgi:mono/diheme cytochrome c family protein